VFVVVSFLANYLSELLWFIDFGIKVVAVVILTGKEAILRPKNEYVCLL
jgi:hypothetical protein